MSEWLLPLCLAPLIVLVFWALTRQLRAVGAWLSAWLRGTVVLLGVGMLGFLLLLANDLSAFHRVDTEGSIATVSFKAIDEQTYLATVTSGDNLFHQVAVQGDVWLLQANVFRWSGLFKALDARPMFRVDALSSRYFAFERAAESRAFSIMQKNIIGLGNSGAISLIAANTGRIGIYHSDERTVYSPLRDGASYQVLLLDGQLVAKPANQVASLAIHQT